MLRYVDGTGDGCCASLRNTEGGLRNSQMPRQRVKARLSSFESSFEDFNAIFSTLFRLVPQRPYTFKMAEIAESIPNGTSAGDVEMKEEASMEVGFIYQTFLNHSLTPNNRHLLAAFNQFQIQQIRSHRLKSRLQLRL